MSGLKIVWGICYIKRMKQSQFFIKTLKEVSKEEKSANAQLLMRGGFVDRLMAGVYTFLPLGFRVLKKIENIIRQEMNNIGGQEIVMPALHPKENWAKTGRWETFDALYKVKSRQKKEFALGPTHEEVLVPLMKGRICSYRDLPVYVYQFQTKFRDEERAKSGLLRGREFLMKDLYSFHADYKDLDRFYEKVKKAYFKIFQKCGISKQTYLTYASGGTFAKYSHEFQTVTESGEDSIFICQNCQVATNEEILDDFKKLCPECRKNDFAKTKSIEVGNIFKLGAKFSEPFSLTYKDKNGKDKFALMGCYGIGLPRLMGAVVEVWHDEKGIIWPKDVSPFLVHLVGVGKDKRVFQEAEKIYSLLLNKGIDVLYDDRQDISPGEKLAEADLIGCAFRLVVSEKTIARKKIELKERSKEDAKLLSVHQLFLALK